jgi:hypothetical protein
LGRALISFLRTVMGGYTLVKQRLDIGRLHGFPKYDLLFVFPLYFSSSSSPTCRHFPAVKTFLAAGGASTAEKRVKLTMECTAGLDQPVPLTAVMLTMGYTAGLDQQVPLTAVMLTMGCTAVLDQH